MSKRALRSILLVLSLLWSFHGSEAGPFIRKRLLIHTAGFNLGLLMRQLIGVGTPRGLLRGHERVSTLTHRSSTRTVVAHIAAREMAFTTGC